MGVTSKKFSVRGINMKRVVTGFDGKGTSIFISQDEPDATYETESFRWTELWNSYPDDTLPIDPPMYVD